MVLRIIIFINSESRSSSTDYLLDSHRVADQDYMSKAIRFSILEDSLDKKESDALLARRASFKR